MPPSTPQARYWLLTIPVQHLATIPQPNNELVYVKGQQEIGAQGLHHWQALAVFSKKVRLATVKRNFCPQAHCEPSRSEAANEYVWKEETRVPDTQFELGQLPKSRARPADWDAVYNDAKAGQFDNIPKDILIRNYSSLKRIRVDNVIPPERENITVNVYWGKSGIGKTRRAWHEAKALTTDVYVKNPNTKWWDGYRGQQVVLIDEFVGRIDISYILKWLDRYPDIVEVKGYSTPLLATTFFITSNVDPTEWYNEINREQKNGLLRRLGNVGEMLEEWTPPNPNPPGEGVFDDLERMLLE